MEQAAKFTKLQMATIMSSSGSNSGKRTKKDKTPHPKDAVLHKCKWCKKMVTHEDDVCWEKPGNEDVIKTCWAKCRHVVLAKLSSTSSSTSDKKKKSPTLTGEQVVFLIHNAHVAAEKGKTKNSKKRKVVYKAKSDSENEEGHIMECIVRT